MTNKITPFTFTKSINEHEYIMEDSLMESEYVPYITNKNFSMFADTIFYANEMNINSWIDSKMQYDYLYNSIRKRKRYAQWQKKSIKSEDIDVVSSHYKYSRKKAKEVLAVLTPEQLEMIKQNNNKGGVT